MRGLELKKVHLARRQVTIGRSDPGGVASRRIAGTFGSNEGTFKVVFERQSLKINISG